MENKEKELEIRENICKNFTIHPENIFTYEVHKICDRTELKPINNNQCRNLFKPKFTKKTCKQVVRDSIFGSRGILDRIL